MIEKQKNWEKTRLKESSLTFHMSYACRLSCKKQWSCESHLHTSPSQLWRWNLWGRSRHNYQACSYTGRYHTAAGSPDTHPHLEHYRNPPMNINEHKNMCSTSDLLLRVSTFHEGKDYYHSEVVCLTNNYMFEYVCVWGGVCINCKF